MRRTAAIGLVLVLAACKGQGSSPAHAKGEGSDIVLAKGKGIEITAADFRALLDEQQPFQRAQLGAPGKKQVMLNRMVQEQILYRQAVEEGLQDDPQVQKLVRSFMVQRLMQRHARQTDPTTVSADDVQKYFAEHAADYQKRVAASIISFQAAQGSPERAQKLAAAKKALADIRAAERRAKDVGAPKPASARPGGLPAVASAAPSPSVVFSKLVAELSDDETTKRFGGSLGFKTRAELEKTLPPELVNALFAMAQNDTSEVIETPQGLYIARVNAVRDELGLDQVRPQIQLRLARQVDEKSWTEFLQKLQADAAVTIDEKALDALVLPAAEMAPGGARPVMPPAHGHGEMMPVPPAQASTQPETK